MHHKKLGIQNIIIKDDHIGSNLTHQKDGEQLINIDPLRRYQFFHNVTGTRQQKKIISSHVLDPGLDWWLKPPYRVTCSGLSSVSESVSGMGP